MQVQFCLARGRVCVRVRARVCIYIYIRKTHQLGYIQVLRDV
jgi:hypothetical protein